MKRKKKDTVEVPVAAEDLTPTVDGASAVEAAWDGPTRAGGAGEIADLAAESARIDADADAATSGGGETLEGAAALGLEGETLEGAGGEGLAAGEGDLPEPIVESAGRLESILESLLHAAERPLSVSDLKRLVNERDSKKISVALEALRARRADTGVQLASLAGGWQLRTHPDNGPWVAKLVAGRPQRLSRAMLETLAIVAYRQPITRPEIDEIRGVDCGPVLKTLLERAFVRILGKKEDVGRPMLYGTTPEFLRTFSLRDLSELPTLREFHELSEQQMASVDAKAPLPEGAQTPAAPARSPFAPSPIELAPVDPEEEDDLLSDLEDATLAASRAAGPPPGAAPGVEASASGPERSEA